MVKVLLIMGSLNKLAPWIAVALVCVESVHLNVLMQESFGFLATNEALIKFKIITIISMTAYFFPFPMMVLREFKTVQIGREMILHCALKK